jgi:hypothetical protein
MRINPNGTVGIGTATPGSLLDVEGRSSATGNTAIIGRGNFAHSIGIWGETTSSILGCGVVGKSNNSSVPAGQFQGDLQYTGELSDISDQRLKENIKPIEEIIDKVMQLNPSSYNFKKDYQKMNVPKRNQMGFVAQEVEKIFPQLVTIIHQADIHGSNTPKYKGLNYIGFIPVLTKAIQEQQKKITTLEDRIAKLETTLNALTLNNKVTINEISGASLEQNRPNPFNNTTTVIGYHIPSNSTSANLLIRDLKGGVVKTFSLSKGSGQVNINSNALAAGTYTYSLWVDNKQVDTKRMVLTR